MGEAHTQLALHEEDLSDDRLLSGLARDGDGRPMLGGIPLSSLIGRGGMGAVYYGMHPRLNMPVAVKVLPAHLAATPEAVARLIAEAQTAARVQSGHLVRVLDVDEQGGLNYIVMEYVDGASAKQYLALQGSRGLPETDALRIVFAATAGLRDAHRAGVVHRDVKPDNILIPKGDDGELDLSASRLTDLGIAKTTQTTAELATCTGVAMGTPGYMAPEQSMDAKTVGRSADLFSMGATLYALLVGRAPFEGSSAMAILMKTMNEPHAPVRSARSDVSERTARLVDRCLAKKPEDRFPDADGLLRELADILGGAVEETDLWATSSTLVRPPRRNRWIARAVAAGVGVIVAGILVGLVIHKRHMRRRAVRAVLAATDRMRAGLPQEALAVVAAARDAGLDEEAGPALAIVVDHVRLQVERIRVRDRAREFMGNLLASEYERCNALVDPEYLKSDRRRVPGLIRIWSFVLRLGGVRPDHLVTGGIWYEGEEWAVVQVAIHTESSERELPALKLVRRDGSWYVCPPQLTPQH